jgi:hypothetical protein
LRSSRTIIGWRGKPPSDPSASAIWEEKDIIAQELITTAIRDEQVIHVSTCNTAAEMWDALRIIHEPQGQQSIISTKRALYSAQAKEGTDIAAHLNFGHKGTECWKNPANRGKGRVSHRDKDKDKGKMTSKGKEHVNVTKDDSESDTESLDRAFTAHVSIVDDNEANFSCYSWIADSGATTHICAQRNVFQNFKEIPKKEIKGLGDRPVDAYGQGTVIISSQVDNHVVKIHLTDTLYIPDARENIISLGRIDSIGGRAICGYGKIHIYDQQRRTIAIGTKKHNIYYLDAGTKTVPEQANVAIKIKKYWHHRATISTY